MRGATVIAPTMRSTSRRRTFSRSSQSYASSDVRWVASAAIPMRHVGHTDTELVAELDRPRKELRGMLVAPQMRMDRTVRAEHAEPSDALLCSRVLEQRHELVPQS